MSIYPSGTRQTPSASLMGILHKPLSSILDTDEIAMKLLDSEVFFDEMITRTPGQSEILLAVLVKRRIYTMEYSKRLTMLSNLIGRTINLFIFDIDGDNSLMDLNNHIYPDALIEKDYNIHLIYDNVKFVKSLFELTVTKTNSLTYPPNCTTLMSMKPVTASIHSNIKKVKVPTTMREFYDLRKVVLGRFMNDYLLSDIEVAMTYPRHYIF